MKKIDLHSVKLGSDAEVFLRTRNGIPFPVCGLVGGTKEKPLILDPKDGCAVQEDNVALEFNAPVSASATSWVKNIQKAMNLAFAKIPPTLEPLIVASCRFDPALLDNKQAQLFGCEPDFNAWSMQQNPRPMPTDPTLRSAAAHVHISWDDPGDIDQRARVIKMADVFVSLPSIDYDKDTDRRTLYGKAGAFRPKKYGVEHRVLSNYWLQNPDYMDMVWWNYQLAIQAANTDYEIPADVGEEVQRCVNESDVNRWKEVFDVVHKGCFGEPVYSRSPSKKKKISDASSIAYGFDLPITQNNNLDNNF